MFGVESLTSVASTTCIVMLLYKSVLASFLSLQIQKFIGWVHLHISQKTWPQHVQNKFINFSLEFLQLLCCYIEWCHHLTSFLNLGISKSGITSTLLSFSYCQLYLLNISQTFLLVPIPTTCK